MRVEFLDVAFQLAERAEEMNDNPTPEQLYRVIYQSLGVVDPSVAPSGGFRRISQTYLLAAEWPRFYDLVLRLMPEFGAVNADTYRNRVNAVLAAGGSAWQLVPPSKLERVLPIELAAQVTDSIGVLRAPGYAAALELFQLAKSAFDAVPRRDRDAAANAFDALESAAKIRFNKPDKTFGGVLDTPGVGRLLTPETKKLLTALEVIRHNHCGHGGAQPFKLKPQEVDLFYVSAAAGARLFAQI